MLRAILGISIASLVVACAGESAQTLDADEIQKNLDESFGGYGSSAEQPNFGSDAVLAVPDLQTQFASHEAAPDSSMPARSYRVALLWGHFPAADDDSDGDTDATPATWSGDVSIDQGSIDVDRTLSFDGTDSVATRASPTSVSFVSETLPFVDGLLLHVTVTGEGPSPTLHFDTGVLSTDVHLDVVAESAGMIFHTSGDQGLAVVAWNDTAGACGGGVAYGRWVKLRAGAGTLRARFVGADGTDRGFAEGIWGHAPVHDADFFFGKMIDTEGKFTALFEGLYDQGTLHGTMGDAVSQNGSFAGVYADGFDAPDGRGAFVAKWMPPCSAL